MEVVLRCTEDDCKEMIEKGLIIHGKRYEVVLFLVADEKAVAIKRCLAGAASNHPCNHCDVFKVAMKELKVGAARTEDSVDKYVKKLGEKAKDVLGAGVDLPLRAGQLVPGTANYDKLQKYSSSSTTVGDYDADNCRGHLVP